MKKIFIVVLAVFILNSCKKSDEKYDKSCTIDKQNEYVYNFMQENYLWYSEIPEVDYRSYSSVYTPDLRLKKP